MASSSPDRRESSASKAQPLLADDSPAPYGTSNNAIAPASTVGVDQRTSSSTTGFASVAARYPNTVAVVNPASGERSASTFVADSLNAILGPSRVLVLSKEVFANPSRLEDLILSYATTKSTPAGAGGGQHGTVIVAGGDGTIAFVMSVIDRLAEQQQQRATLPPPPQPPLMMTEQRAADELLNDLLCPASPPTTPGVQPQLPNSPTASSFPVMTMPAVAALAMGTGNDFSNFCGYGAGYTRHPCCCLCVCMTNHVQTIVDRLVASPAVPFDRWEATITSSLDAHEVQKFVFMNYFSIGMDAFIARNFDLARKAHPSCFQTRFQNKAFYGALGLYGWWKCDRLNPFLPKLTIRRAKKKIGTSSDTTTVSGEYETISTVLPPKSKAIVISNVNSYSGGTTPWIPSKSSSSKTLVTSPATNVFINDRKVEVMALGGLVDMSMLQLKLGGGADKIAQTDEVDIVVGSGDLPLELYVQIDGEPGPILKRPSKVAVKLFPKQIWVRCANPNAVAPNAPPPLPFSSSLI